MQLVVGDGISATSSDAEGMGPAHGGVTPGMRLKIQAQPMWQRPAAWLAVGWLALGVVGYASLFRSERLFVVLGATNLALHYWATAPFAGRGLRWAQAGSVVLILLPALSYFDPHETFWLAWSLGYPAGWILAFATLGIITWRAEPGWTRTACCLAFSSFVMVSVAHVAFYFFSLHAAWILAVVSPGTAGAAMNSALPPRGRRR